MMSMAPRIVSASAPSAKAQPGNVISTESGTRSPSEFTTGDGLSVGTHVVGSTPSNAVAAMLGKNIPPPSERVMPSSSPCASAVIASPRERASSRLKAGVFGAVLSWLHAATRTSAMAAVAAGSQRRKGMESMIRPPEPSGTGGITIKSGTGPDR